MLSLLLLVHLMVSSWHLALGYLMPLALGKPSGSILLMLADWVLKCRFNYGYTFAVNTRIKSNNGGFIIPTKLCWIQRLKALAKIHSNSIQLNREWRRTEEL